LDINQLLLGEASYLIILYGAEPPKGLSELISGLAHIQKRAFGACLSLEIELISI
jgi:hypothetical protein